MNSFLKTYLRQNKRSNLEIGSFEGHGISWYPAPASPGDTVQINYRGLLQDSGADSVYLHYAFDSWSSPAQTVKMERTGDSFSAEIKAAGNHELNFCFKDSANNWDNNNGSNWTVHLQ